MEERIDETAIKMPNVEYRIKLGGGLLMDMYGKQPNILRRFFIKLLLDWDIEKQ